jgi:hypothetical protein
LREFLSNAAYLIIVTLVAMAFAAIWHDFSVEFHKAMPRHSRAISSRSR